MKSLKYSIHGKNNAKAGIF